MTFYGVFEARIYPFNLALPTIPAKAGIHLGTAASCALGSSWSWIPACAGIIGGAGVRDENGPKLLSRAPFRSATSVSRIGNRTKRLKLHQTAHVCTPLHDLFSGVSPASHGTRLRSTGPSIPAKRPSISYCQNAASITGGPDSERIQIG